MKYLLFILILLSISCKSQTISLERRAECYNDPDNCPTFNYVKDINNTLDKYVGTWKGTYDGKTYEMQFKKGVYQDITLSDKKRDILIGRLRIKDTNGIILYDTFSEPDDEKTNFSGLGLQPDLKAYRMIFSDNSPQGCINYGNVFLTIKPATPTTLGIFYWSDYDIVQGECPSSFKTTLLEKKDITLIKQ